MECSLFLLLKDSPKVFRSLDVIEAKILLIYVYSQDQWKIGLGVVKRLIKKAYSEYEPGRQEKEALLPKTKICDFKRYNLYYFTWGISNFH